ncbi:hypothetical protein L0244_18430 [bacterium]|nr:hypothetical protein [bacterium]
MPPQVRMPDAGTPVNSQAPDSIEQSKTTEVDKNAGQKQEPPKQDAQTAAKNAEAAKQHAAGRKQQNVADEQMVRNNLDQKVPDKGAWGFVKDAARLASDAAGVGAAILRESTAQASKQLLEEKQKRIEEKMESLEEKKSEKEFEEKMKSFEKKMNSIEKKKLAE